MAQTDYSNTSASAIKRYATRLHAESMQSSFYMRQLASKGSNSAIQYKEDLETASGGSVDYVLSLATRQQPTYGDSILKGNEAQLKRSTATVKIDQIRFAVSAGGKAAQKRVVGDLRNEAIMQLKSLNARTYDEMVSIYTAGMRGTNANFNLDFDFAGFAGNPITAPDAAHQVYAGAATSSGTIAGTDIMSLAAVAKVATRASNMLAATGCPRMEGIDMDGDERFIMVMSPNQAHDLRANTAAGEWLDIQKYANMGKGEKSPLMSGALGVYRGVIMHQNTNTITFDGGAGGSVKAARATILGKQAAVVAFGSPTKGAADKQMFKWVEETEDYGNLLNVASSSIMGIRKSTYEIDGVTRDFGVIALDTVNIDRSI